MTTARSAAVAAILIKKHSKKRGRCAAFAGETPNAEYFLLSGPEGALECGSLLPL
jgi:hypothetical protein